MMAVIHINYHIMKRVQIGHRRDYEHEYYGLTILNGVWLNEATGLAIRNEISRRHPGWFLNSYSKVSKDRRLDDYVQTDAG